MEREALRTKECNIYGVASEYISVNIFNFFEVFNFSVGSMIWSGEIETETKL